MEKNQIVFSMVVLLSVLLLSFYGTKVHSAIVEQPLSKIAIHKATVALTDSASIKASPLVLGRTGEDYEWVVVNFEHTGPSNDDWIGVFSPAIFNGSICHYESEPNDQGDICSAPIKYQFANYSNSDYVKTGKASLEFRLINQREDFSFALFQGGLSNPHLIALSNSISFENPKEPLYPRLAQGKSWNEMTITWTSGYNPSSEALAIVEWGRKGQENEISPATSMTFNIKRMCGSPAHTFGWRNPGFIHTSTLRDLWPNTIYTYQLGHILLSNEHTVIWSKAYSFRSPPPPGQDSLQQVIILGNMGKGELDGSNEYANYQRGSHNTTDQLVNDLNNIDMVFHLGKMVYANGYISQWDQFTEQVKIITSGVPYMIASDNHDRGWHKTALAQNIIDSGGECGVPETTMFNVPGVNSVKLWYSSDYGRFRFCVADSEYEWEEGSDQYEFIEHCLSSVDRLLQPWLIFVVHRPWEESRESMEKLWQKYKVDIVFYGHVHNYERTCPLYEGVCVTSERSHYAGKVNGTIHVEVGGSGSYISHFSKFNTSWSLYRDVDFGFVKLTSLDYNTLLFEYKKSSDGKVYDSFTIYREFRDFFARQ